MGLIRSAAKWLLQASDEHGEHAVKVLSWRL
jgi:hypothetical protein